MIYVSSVKGKNSNTGRTPSRPKRTYSGALRALSPFGDAIVFLPGHREVLRPTKFGLVTARRKKKGK